MAEDDFTDEDLFRQSLRLHGLRKPGLLTLQAPDGRLDAGRAQALVPSLLSRRPQQRRKPGSAAGTADVFQTAQTLRILESKVDRSTGSPIDRTEVACAEASDEQRSSEWHDR